MATSSFTRKLPSVPVQLSGHEFCFPQKVMEVMHSSWQSHIPLTALLSKPLLSLSDRDPLAATPKPGRAISLMAALEDKDEPFMVTADWWLGPAS